MFIDFKWAAERWVEWLRCVGTAQNKTTYKHVHFYYWQIAFWFLAVCRLNKAPVMYITWKDIEKKKKMK